MAATNRVTNPPDNSADKEARALLRVQSQTIPGRQLTQSNGSVGSRVAGQQVSGQTRLTGGSV